MDSQWATFGLGVLSTVVGGLCLTLIFFVFKEVLFADADIEGAWTIEVNVAATSYKPYRGMKIYYNALIWKEGNKIRGKCEKAKTVYLDGKVLDHPMEQRIPNSITGYSRKAYLKNSDTLRIQIDEKGSVRSSTAQHHLTFNKSLNTLVGHFVSTAANSRGSATWRRSNAG